MDNLTDIDLLEEYLRGDLSAEEKTLLEKRLEREPVLTEQFKALQELENGFRYTRLKEILSDMSSWELEGKEEKENDEFEKEVAEMIRLEKSRSVFSEIQGFEKNDTNVLKVKWNWLKIAAGFALALGACLYLFVFFPNNEKEDLVANYFDIYPIIDNSRGEASGNHKIAAFKSYMEGDFKAAEEHFLAISSNKEVSVNFYLGVSQLGEGHTKAAITTLEKLKEQSELFEIPIYWYLALSYLDIGEIKVAKDYLELVINAKDFKATEALKLKRELELTE